MAEDTDRPPPVKDPLRRFAPLTGSSRPAEPHVGNDGRGGQAAFRVTLLFRVKEAPASGGRPGPPPLTPTTGHTRAQPSQRSALRGLLATHLHGREDLVTNFGVDVREPEEDFEVGPKRLRVAGPVDPQEAFSISDPHPLMFIVVFEGPRLFENLDRNHGWWLLRRERGRARKPARRWASVENDSGGGPGRGAAGLASLVEVRDGPGRRYVERDLLVEHPLPAGPDSNRLVRFVAHASSQDQKDHEKSKPRAPHNIKFSQIPAVAPAPNAGSFIRARVTYRQGYPSAGCQGLF